MEIKIQWHQPIPLQDGSAEDLIYMVDEKKLQAWDGYAGVYMFCRRYGESVIPMYIGRSMNIYNRIWEHLEGQTGVMDSMKAIRQRGEKMLIIGEYIPQPGWSSTKAIAIVERALIEHALTEGYVLLNKAGTKTPTHEVRFSGFNMAKQFSGGTMYVKKSG
jgi:hypothetical protein